MSEPVWIPLGASPLPEFAWTPYTPVWSGAAATGTPPTLGNGLIEGRYCRNGKLVIATGAVKAGSTSNPGTALLLLSLPLPIVQAPITGYFNGFGSARLLDTDVANYGGMILPADANNVYIMMPGAQQIWTGTFPFVFADGDSASMQVIYETP